MIYAAAATFYDSIFGKVTPTLRLMNSSATRLEQNSTFAVPLRIVAQKDGGNIIVRIGGATMRDGKALNYVSKMVTPPNFGP